MSSSVSNLQLLNNTEHRVKFKTGSDINNALIQPTTTHSLSFNGTDQHGIISDLEINGAFTISMWIKLKIKAESGPKFKSGLGSPKNSRYVDYACKTKVYMKRFTQIRFL